MRPNLFISIVVTIIFMLPNALFAQNAQKKILIGLIPEMNIFKQKSRFVLLGDYLTKKTGVPVEFTILSRYGNIIDKFKADRMDGAFFGSFTGALAIKKLDVVPLARPVNLDGSSTYQGYLFVKKNSGIKTASDMKGKRMAFVDKATTAGYIFPLAYLRRNGITNTEAYFKESFFTGSHDAAILSVLNGKADIGSAKHSIYNRVRSEDPRVDRELVIIEKSPMVPSNGLCVRKDLDPGIRKKLLDALLNIHNDQEGKVVLEKFGALKFLPTTAQDYQPVLDMASQAGIDLKTYRYKNN